MTTTGVAGSAETLTWGAWQVTVHTDASVSVATEGQQWTQERVEVFAALGGRIPETIIETFALVEVWRAHAPDLPLAEIVRLADEQTITVVAEASAGPHHGPAATLFAHHPEPYVRCAFAIGLDESGTNWFPALARDEDMLVRARVAMHPLVPATVHAVLAQDPDAAVREAARRNPATRLTEAARALPEQAPREAVRLSEANLVWEIIMFGASSEQKARLSARRDAPVAVLGDLARLGYGDPNAVVDLGAHRGWLCP